MFSNRPTKSQLRREHEKKISEFLAHGGEIKQVRQGATGLIDGSYNNRHIRLGGGEHKAHTPIPDVIAAIDSRRQRSKTRKPLRPQHAGRHRKVIFDDFGEPLRTVWVSEGSDSRLD